MDDDLTSTRCTVCSRQIVPTAEECYLHRELHVLLCKVCVKVHQAGEITKDEKGQDDFCRWCADGGSLIVCDTCSNVFCRRCIKTNLGRAKANEISNKDKWNCFVCNPKPIQHIQEVHRKLWGISSRGEAETEWKMTSSTRIVKDNKDTTSQQQQHIGDSGDNGAPTAVSFVEFVEDVVEDDDDVTNDVVMKVADDKLDDDDDEGDESDEGDEKDEEQEKGMKNLELISLVVQQANQNIRKVSELCLNKESTSDVEVNFKQVLNEAADKLSSIVLYMTCHGEELATSLPPRKDILSAMLSSSSSKQRAVVGPGDLIQRSNPTFGEDEESEEEDFKPSTSRSKNKSRSKTTTTTTDQDWQNDEGEGETSTKKRKISPSDSNAEEEEEEVDEDEEFEKGVFDLLNRKQKKAKKIETDDEEDKKGEDDKEEVEKEEEDKKGEGEEESNKSDVEKLPLPKKKKKNPFAKYNADDLDDDDIVIDEDEDEEEEGLEDLINDDDEEEESNQQNGGDNIQSTQMTAEEAAAKKLADMMEDSDEEEEVEIDEDVSEVLDKEEAKEAKKPKNREKSKEEENVENAEEPQNADDNADASSSKLTSGYRHPLLNVKIFDSDGEDDDSKSKKRKTRKRKLSKEASPGKETKNEKDDDNKETSSNQKRLRVDDDTEEDEAMEVDEQPATSGATTVEDDDEEEKLMADCSQPLFSSQPEATSANEDDIGDVEGMENIKFILKDVTIPVIRLTAEQIEQKRKELQKEGQRKSSGSDPNDVNDDDEKNSDTNKTASSDFDLKISSAEEEDDNDVIDDDDDDEEEFLMNLKSRKGASKKTSPVKKSTGGESPIRIEDSDSDVEIVGVQNPPSTSSGGSGGSKSDESESDDDEMIITRKKPKRFINDYYQKVNSGDEFQESIANRTRRRRPKMKEEKKRTVEVSESESARSSDEEESDDDDDDDDDDDEEKSPQKNRKNIRKILKDSDLSQETKLAADREIQRKLRMENNDDVVLVSDTEQGIGRILFSKNPKIEIARPLVKVLKSHQIDGIKFLWSNVVENVETAKKSKGNGCILAHCMGLGKTLQTITFLHTVLTSNHLETLNTALVLCPTGTVLNWGEECRKWTRKCNKELHVYKISQRDNTNVGRKLKFKQWHQTGGIMILGYGLFRQLHTTRGTRKQQKMLLKEIEGYLLTPGPDIVVCDEGHILKNSRTTLSGVVNKIKTRRRIVLTGTPLQNNLREYHCMVSFVKPRLLGNLKEFNNRFANPIQNGQHSDSTRGDVHIMKKRSHVLHELLSGCIQRKDFKCLSDQLKPKFEYVLFIRLTPLQIRMYEHYLGRTRNKANCKERLANSLFNDFTNFLLIVSHPRVFEVKKQIKDKEELKKNFDDVDDEEEEAETTSSSSNSEDEDGEKKSKRINVNEIPAMGIRVLKEHITERGGDFSQCNEKRELQELLRDLLSTTTSTTDRDWWQAVVPKDPTLLHKCESSGKIMVMLEILKQARSVGDKVVLFSQSVVTLTMIEVVLKEIDDCNREYNKRDDLKREDKELRWKKDSDYLRIDGQTSFDTRKYHVDRFNRAGSGPSLLLVSTRAGGIGINLFGANRAIIFDACWNPTHDLQSIYRIYRFGQKKKCYIYRLIAQGTMEQKIYERQISKRSISSRVVDEQQVGRHFSHKDLLQLYQFTPDRLTTKNNKKEKTAQEVEDEKNKPKPKDRLLKNLLEDSNAGGHIVSFQEEDTLLGHQVTEELSEGERRAAWDEYDRENHPPVLATSPLLQFNGAQLKAMIALAQNELKRNQNILDNLKEFSYVRILALIVNHDCKLTEEARHVIALKYLNQRQVFLYQLNQTRKYILHKVEQAQYCLEHGHAKVQIPVIMGTNPTNPATNPMFGAATNDPRHQHRNYHPQPPQQPPPNFHSYNPQQQRANAPPPGGRRNEQARGAPFFAGYYQNGGGFPPHRPHV